MCTPVEKKTVTHNKNSGNYILQKIIMGIKKLVLIYCLPGTCQELPITNFNERHETVVVLCR